MRENFLFWEFVKHLQKVCKITESTKFWNIISEVYSNQWAVGAQEMPNISKTEGTCHALMPSNT
jgi:hypothetical protein